jgi:uncharacterized protein YciI
MVVVVVRRWGPQWDASRPLEEQSDWAAHASFMDGLVDAGFLVMGGPLADGDRVVHVVEAESEDAIRNTLARDPWSETHLRIGFASISACLSTSAAIDVTYRGSRDRNQRGSPRERRVVR